MARSPGPAILSGNVELQMRPSLATRNRADSAVIDSVCCCDVLNSITTDQPLSNDEHVGFSEARCRMKGPNRPTFQAGPEGVQGVLALGHNFKIPDDVSRLDAVLVVHRHAIGDWTNKRGGYKPMNQEVPIVPIANAKQNTVISVAPDVWCHHSAGVSSVPVALTTHVAKVTDCVVAVKHGAPLFGHVFHSTAVQ